MQTYHIYPNFADTYGQSTYGSCAYNQTTACATTVNGGTGATSGSTSTLANTGILLIAIATAACVLIFMALVIRFWRKPSKKSSDTPTPQPPLKS